MARMVVTRDIAAPVEKVFQTVADIRNFSKAVPHITSVEFLSDQRCGVGTRFRETRLMGGKEASTELEVTEYQENDHVRIVADTHGTIWDTVFKVEPAGSGATLLTMTMDATGRKVLSRLVNTMIMGMVKKAVEKDMDAVKVYCEA